MSQTIGNRRVRRHPLIGISALLVVMVSSGCSDDSLADLGMRSSDWIGEVATTAPTTTTTAPVLTYGADEAEWMNDEFGAPDAETPESTVLAEVFARSGDSSRFLQASRQEIVTVVPDVQFLSEIPVEVRYITSQLVIESRELRLADDPTVAFGMWTVEPYTRSRSVGQMGVLNASRDPGGVDIAEQNDVQAVCTVLVPAETTCGSEELGSMLVWRIEETVVTHVWFSDPFRYELQGLESLDEELVHEMIMSMRPLSEMLPGSG